MPCIPNMIVKVIRAIDIKNVTMPKINIVTDIAGSALTGVPLTVTLACPVGSADIANTRNTNDAMAVMNELAPIIVDASALPKQVLAGSPCGTGVGAG